jgi:protein-disulfide isomerase
MIGRGAITQLLAAKSASRQLLSGVLNYVRWCANPVTKRQERMNLNRNEGGRIKPSWLSANAALTVIAAGIFALTLTFGIARAASPNPVVATVGTHRITQDEVDHSILQGVSPARLYDLRKSTLDRMINDYLLNQAAKQAHVTPDAYLKSQIHSKKITEADAKKYYNDNKDRFGKTSFDEVKIRLILALQQQEDSQQMDQALAKLRDAQKVNIALVAPRVQVASADHPSVGAKDAPITMVEFGDFQCPFCRASENAVKEVRQKYGDKVRLVYMDFPLGIHAHAMDAANAARCAGEQDKFWQYHDAIFADQSKLAPADLKASAAKLGLDAKKFGACLDKTKYQSQIQQDMAEATKLGVTGTPTFFINGREITGAQPANKFEEIIDDEMAKSEHPGAQRQASAKQ